MIERPDNSCAYLSSAVNAKVAQLARWTWRHPRVVNVEVNHQIGVRSRRRATEAQLREALRYVEGRLREALTQVRRQ